MDIKYLNQLLSDNAIVTEKIKQYIDDKSIKKLPLDKEELRGHIIKADHNLKFVNDNIGLGYFDWCLT